MAEPEPAVVAAGELRPDDIIRYGGREVTVLTVFPIGDAVLIKWAAGDEVGHATFYASRLVEHVGYAR